MVDRTKAAKRDGRRWSHGQRRPSPFCPEEGLEQKEKTNVSVQLATQDEELARLAQDARRVTGMLRVVLADAERLGVPVDGGAEAYAAVYTWTDRLLVHAQDRGGS